MLALGSEVLDSVAPESAVEGGNDDQSQKREQLCVICLPWARPFPAADW
jgi:hypothetical protein